VDHVSSPFSGPNNFSYSPSKSLKFRGIKNEGFEVIKTPPNPSPSSFKKTSR